MLHPKVSILIPLYNAERYIAETIQSALNQTWPNIEIIIVDDGSTDNSYATAKSFESDIVKVYQQENKWGSAARNKAFSHSTGEYIQYLDADDILAPTKIEEQMNLLLKNGNSNAIANCRYARFVGDISKSTPVVQKVDKTYEKPIQWLIEAFNGGGKGLVSLWLTPRAIIEKTGEWNEKLKYGDDGEFFCRAILHASKIIHVPKTLFYYRDTEDSVSKSRSYESAQMYLQVYDSIAAVALKYSNNERIKLGFAKKYTYFYFLFYPQFPDLLVEAENRVKNLGFKKFVRIGAGTIMTILQTLFGFKRAVCIYWKFVNSKSK